MVLLIATLLPVGLLAQKNKDTTKVISLKEIIVNGEKNKGYFVPHKLFRRGGTMEIKTEE